MAGVEQLHAPRRASKQWLAQLGFEPGDPPTQGRLTDVQAPRGSTDGALFGDGHKSLEVDQGHAPS